jgi:hypothetical protein
MVLVVVIRVISGLETGEPPVTARRLDTDENTASSA